MPSNVYDKEFHLIDELERVDAPRHKNRSIVNPVITEHWASKAFGYNRISKFATHHRFGYNRISKFLIGPLLHVFNLRTLRH
jgi:hypothetical protein